MVFPNKETTSLIEFMAADSQIATTIRESAANINRRQCR